MNPVEKNHLRSFGGDIPKAHAAIGAVPVTVAVQDIYESLQKGVLDYSFLPITVCDAQKLVEVGNIYRTHHAMSGHIIAIGKPTWNNCPKIFRISFGVQV
jgi:TRAP-type C4-dicarboxylate transport system substrate-binding protein